MLDVLCHIVDDNKAQRAPLLQELDPVPAKLWICAACLKSAPAIGLQRDLPPTDWGVYSTPVNKSFFKNIYVLLCNDCKDNVATPDWIKQWPWISGTTPTIIERIKRLCRIWR